jgi:hypothetical protein
VEPESEDLKVKAAFGQSPRGETLSPQHDDLIVSIDNLAFQTFVRSTTMRGKSSPFDSEPMGERIHA